IRPPGRSAPEISPGDQPRRSAAGIRHLPVARCRHEDRAVLEGKPRPRVLVHDQRPGLVAVAPGDFVADDAVALADLEFGAGLFTDAGQRDLAVEVVADVVADDLLARLGHGLAATLVVGVALPALVTTVDLATREAATDGTGH